MLPVLIFLIILLPSTGHHQDIDNNYNRTASGTTGGPSVTTGAGAPSSTPAAEGDIYVDTTNDNVYVAAGTASSADWKQATGAGGGDLLAANNLSDVADAGTARTNLGVDAAGTDNSTDVTLAGTPDYITLAGQVITRNPAHIPGGHKPHLLVPPGRGGWQPPINRPSIPR